MATYINLLNLSNMIIFLIITGIKCNFTNICKQLETGKVRIMSMGPAPTQHSFILLVDTLNYYKADMANLTIPLPLKSDSDSMIYLQISQDTKVLQMIESIDDLRELLALVQSFTTKFPFGAFTITIDNADYFVIFIVYNKHFYHVFTKIHPEDDISDDVKFGKLESIPSYTILSSATPSEIYTLESENGCLTRLRYGNRELNKTQNAKYHQVQENLLSVSLLLGTNSFVNNAPTLNVKVENTSICLSMSGVINGGYYDDAQNLLIAYSNERRMMYIYNADLSNSSPTTSTPLEPVQSLSWLDFLVCPNGGSIDVPDKQEAFKLASFIADFVTILLVVFTIAFICLMICLGQKR